MSDIVSSGTSPILTIEGQVTAHFIDGQALEGEYKAQDAFNIFLIVAGEPVMIPRTQIRFIKGKHPNQIAIDLHEPKERQITTETLLKPVPPVADMSAQEEEEEGTIILDPATTTTSPEEELDDEGTFILPPVAIAETPATDSTPEPAKYKDEKDEKDEDEDEEEEDGTLILNVDQVAQDTEDDEGTFVLPPFSQDEDDPDSTDVMPPLPEEPADESDTTIVMPHKDKSETTAKLSCTGGPHAGDEFILKAGITTVGRSSDNVIVLSKDKEISRHHAILIQESGNFVIQDQNSLNGTFVNDQQITSPHYLKDGDSIFVGLSLLEYKEG